MRPHPTRLVGVLNLLEVTCGGQGLLAVPWDGHSDWSWKVIDGFGHTGLVLGGSQSSKISQNSPNAMAGFMDEIHQPPINQDRSWLCDDVSLQFKFTHINDWIPNIAPNYKSSFKRLWWGGGWVQGDGVYQGYSIHQRRGDKALQVLRTHPPEKGILIYWHHNSYEMNV